MKIGVLAFHGDFAEHIAILRKLDVSHSEVRTLSDIEKCTHLIIPGGESTVMSANLKKSGLDKEIQKRVSENTLSVFGTCAGAILLATYVTGQNTPEPLAIIDMTIDRNAYGTQSQSFDALLEVQGLQKSLTASFIRAPIITEVSPGVEVLATYEGRPVVVRQGTHMAATCHPEVQDDPALHLLFLQ